MTHLYCILAQATASAPAASEAAQQGAGSSQFSPFIIMLLFIGAMYFFMIAPQKKRQKQHNQMLDSLQSGDSIVTIGGIFGKITNKTDKTFTIKISDNTKIEILKSAVSSKVEEGKDAPASPDSQAK